MRYWPRSTAGSPRALTPLTSRRPRRCLRPWAIFGKDFTVIEYACHDAPWGMGRPHSFGKSYCGYARLNAGIPCASSTVADRRFTLGGLQNDWSDEACLSGGDGLEILWEQPAAGRNHLRVGPSYR